MIIKKTREQIDIMREGGRILANIMKDLGQMIAPGVGSMELDVFANKSILGSGGKPSFLGYNDFPAALCVSVNDEIVHGAPSSEKILKEGDIVSLDIGLFYKGFHSDMARTFAVGLIPEKTAFLIEITRESLNKGIEKAVVGNRFSDISKAVQDYVEDKGLRVVRDLCGHGIGRNLHEDPQILNFAHPGEGKDEIKEGMVFCIEPMATLGDWRIKEAEGGCGISTIDNSLSAHFEDTLAATKKGPLILTRLG